MYIRLLSLIVKNLLINYYGWKLLKIDTYSSTDDRYLERGVFQNSHPYFILGATKEIYYSYPPTMISEHHYF